MRRRLALMLFVPLILLMMLNAGCVFGKKLGSGGYTKYSYEFFGAFDSVTQIVGYSESEEQFEIMAKKCQARLEELHKLFDIYHNYEGINNIKTINDNAGIKPVEVRQEIIDLIQFSKEWYYKAGKVVNIALGPVLSIWHTYREEGKSDPSKAKIPDLELLKKAMENTDIEKVEVDPEKKTVFLQEKGMSLDVGAVAKGFATEILVRELQSEGFTSFIISNGGNIRTVGKPMDGKRSKWSIGIQNPDGNPLIPDDEPLDTVYIEESSVVTSGDYQRYYVVNGQRLHHLIDPNTLMPADHYRSVTVVTKDSGMADFLSSALFILPYEQSRALADSLEGVDALWVMKDGSLVATDNMKNSLKKMGGASNK